MSLGGNIAQLRVINREPLKTFYASHIIEEPPPPEWIWDGLALRGTVVVLGGDGGVGKSLLLQQLLSCSALGRPCLGRHVERVKAFGWFCEDSEDWLKRRQLWINEHLGVMPPDYELNFQMESRAARDCLLVDFRPNGKMVPTDNWRPF